MDGKIKTLGIVGKCSEENARKILTFLREMENEDEFQLIHKEHVEDFVWLKKGERI